MASAGKSAQVLQRLGAAFPELQAALGKPATDLAAQKSVLGALDILLHARAPREEVAAVAVRWSAMSDATGNTRSALETFDRLNSFDPSWRQAQSARIRLLLHENRPVQALRLIDSSKYQQELASLRGLALVRTDPKEAARLFESAKDYTNLGALLELGGKGDEAKTKYVQAISLNPNSLAALNGARQYKDVIGRQYDGKGTASDFNARIAQALTGLGSEARVQLLAVTAEGLFRSAISNLESCVSVGKRKAYNLQLALALDEYALLLKKWVNREKEADKLVSRANDIRATTSSLLPSFSFELKGWTIDEDDH